MSAIIQAPPPGPMLKVEQARAILAECRSVDEAKEIADQAAAVKVYLRQQKAALDAQNDAAEIQLRAGVRVGELLQEQAEKGQRQRRGDAGRAKANAPKAQAERLAPPPTLEDLGIERNQAQRFQELARVPEEKRETFIRAQREGGGEITAAGLLRVAKSRDPHAASRVNDGDPEKNERYTRKALREELQRRFRFEVDAFGHPAAPMSRLIGNFYTKEQNAFAQDFTMLRTFFQPPWDLMAETVEFIDGQAAKGMPLGVLLMPANREEQAFWHRFIEPYRPDRGGSGVRVEFLEGREHYGNPDDPECEDKANQNAGMPSCLVIWEGPRQRAPGFEDDGPPLRQHVGAEPASLDRRSSGGVGTPEWEERIKKLGAAEGR